MTIFKRTPTASLDSLVDRMWTLTLGRDVNEVFSAGVTVMINAAAHMPQEVRSELAARIRAIADGIQTGEFYEIGKEKSE